MMSENPLFEKGMVIEIAADELQKMLRDRAEGHDKRFAAYAVRIERLAVVVQRNVEDAVKTAHEMHGDDEEDNAFATSILSNSSAQTVYQQIERARDRQRAHKSAAAWLRFTAAHLPARPVTFLRDDAFIAYLLDIENPIAMPTGFFSNRGIQ